MPQVNDGSHLIDFADYPSFLSKINDIDGVYPEAQPAVIGGYAKFKFKDGSMFIGQFKTIAASSANPTILTGLYTDPSSKVEAGVLTFAPSTGTTFTKAFAPSAAAGGGGDGLGTLDTIDLTPLKQGEIGIIVAQNFAQTSQNK